MDPKFDHRSLVLEALRNYRSRVGPSAPEQPEDFLIDFGNWLQSPGGLPPPASTNGLSNASRLSLRRSGRVRSTSTAALERADSLNHTLPLARILAAVSKHRMAEFTLLSRMGYDVVLASCAGEALARAAAGTFDAYVVEGDLPDGIDLCRSIHQLSPTTPLIFYASDGHPQSRDRAITAGADAYLVGPAQGTQLERTIRDVAIGRRGM